MKWSVVAVLFHSSDISNEDERHKYCPRTASSCCKWWSDKDNGERRYKKNMNLPLAIMEELKPIFKDLSNDDLLLKCLHGQTQNENECLNAFVWRKCPKDVYVSRRIVELGSCSAVIEFNDGKSGKLQVLRTLGMVTGIFTCNGCRRMDHRRISSSVRKSTDKSKKRRKQLRAIRKGYADKEREQEGCEAYASGKY